MLAALPLLCFVALALGRYGVGNTGWRGHVLTAAVIWGMLVVIITEALSALGAIGYVQVVVAWACALATTCLFLLRRPLRVSYEARGHDPLTLAFVAAVVAIAAVTLLIALASAPNTWDAMTYHLARVAHWQQDHNVDFYPTNIVRQLYQPPWAEYAILQFQILGHGDRFANSVQWFSMAGSLVVVSLVARQFGAEIRGQALAAVFAATLPLGILQASSTQNDYVCSFWLICLVSLVLSFREHREVWTAGLAGASLGLSALTKGTALIYGAPVLLVLAGPILVRGRKREWSYAALAVAISLVVNGPFLARNEMVFARLTGPETAIYSNSAMSLSRLIANLSRNVSLQLGLNAGADRLTLKLLQSLFHVLGLGLNDPATTWQHGAFTINPLTTQEDLAGNPFHLIVIVAVALLAIFRRRLGIGGLAKQYVVVLPLGFVLLSLVFRWQPWGSRLEFPLFILAAPFVGLVLAKLPRMSVVVAVILLMASTLWLCLNYSRPLISSGAFRSVLTTPRMDQYFAARPELERMYASGARVATAQECRRVGLVTTLDGWEYPIWEFLKHDGAVSIEDVGIQNASRSLENAAPYRSFQPCSILAVRDQAYPIAAVHSWRGHVYREYWHSGPVSVLREVS